MAAKPFSFGESAFFFKFQSGWGFNGGRSAMAGREGIRG
jgi:hypothetical protein